MKQYILNIIVALSQLTNALLAGNENEMLSARCYRESLKGQVQWVVLRIVLDTVFFLDPNHCYNAYMYEQNDTRV